MFRKLLVTVSIAASGYSTQASNSDIAEGMGQKAISGGVNLLTGVFELPLQTVKGYQNGCDYFDSEFGSRTAGTALGVCRGFGHWYARGAWGGMELFGFWTANPPHNHGIGLPFDSQYAWEMGTQHSMFEPNFAQGCKPIARKLVYGVINTFGGVIEVPAQMIKGSGEGDIVGGLGKGVWFWFSREWYGITSVFTCIVPNPEENPGYAFDGFWPWSAVTE